MSYAIINLMSSIKYLLNFKYHHLNAIKIIITLSLQTMIMNFNK